LLPRTADRQSDHDQEDASGKWTLLQGRTCFSVDEAAGTRSVGDRKGIAPSTPEAVGRTAEQVYHAPRQVASGEGVEESRATGGVFVRALLRREGAHQDSRGGARCGGQLASGMTLSRHQEEHGKGEHEPA
jgi:hypothetical protein